LWVTKFGEFGHGMALWPGSNLFPVPSLKQERGTGRFTAPFLPFNYWGQAPPSLF
jgi:hypothetical protein